MMELQKTKLNCTAHSGQTTLLSNNEHFCAECMRRKWIYLNRIWYGRRTCGSRATRWFAAWGSYTYIHMCVRVCVCQRIGHAACHSNAQATCAVSPNELNNLTLEMIIKWKIIAQCTHSLSHCTVAFMIMTFGNWRCGSNVSATAE